ncbi:MAG: hypothetical protein ACP5H1_07815, partial [Acidilobus sp.]
MKFISFGIILFIIHNYPFTKVHRLLHYYHHAEEGATVNSMSNVRGRRAPYEAPRVLEGSGSAAAP